MAKMNNNDLYFIIDFDNTLVKGESLELLADIVLEKNQDRQLVLDQIKQVTIAGMEGKTTFDKSLETRLALFYPRRQHLKKLSDLLKKSVTESVLQNKDFFTANADKIYIISGGFKEFILPVASMLDISPEHILANEFIYQGDQIVGFNKINPLTQPGGKAVALKKLGLNGQIIAIGDGYTDYELKRHQAADKFVAFVEHVNRKTVVQNADLIAHNFHDIVRFARYLNDLKTYR